jgi:hypothetical protein
MRNQRNHVAEVAVAFATVLHAYEEQAVVQDHASREAEAGGADEQVADE